eukprot:5270450-Alexandrium_andersonii.AAC.1
MPVGATGPFAWPGVVESYRIGRSSPPSAPTGRNSSFRAQESAEVRDSELPAQAPRFRRRASRRASGTQSRI